MLDRMENAGHIVRVPSEKDRRQIKIYLTDRAKELQGKYDSVSNQMSELFYDGFSDGEIKIFEEMLNRILINLEGEKR